MEGYTLSRALFDWSFENPDKVNTNHIAIYFFAIEHCNRLGWKDKFGFPTQMAMDAVGIRKHQTFIKYFNELVGWGFIKLIQKSQNQYSSNIISLQSAMPKNGKALDKALIGHGAKQSASIGQSTGQSNGPIDKQVNNKQSAILIEGFTEAFAAQWERWEQFRKEKRNPITPTSKQSQLKMLGTHPEAFAIAIIEKSITNGWIGLFPDKVEKVVPSPNTQSTAPPLRNVKDLLMP